MNAANEIAVAAFLDEKISFLSIAELVESVLSAQINGKASDIDAIMALDNLAREKATELRSSFR